ncbi:ribonuclease H-like domain-containing protein [Tanacetum coccineum]
MPIRLRHKESRNGWGKRSSAAAGTSKLKRLILMTVLSTWQKEYKHHWKPERKRSTGFITTCRNWNGGASWYDIFETALVEFEFVDVMHSRKPIDRTPPMWSWCSSVENCPSRLLFMGKEDKCGELGPDGTKSMKGIGTLVWIMDVFCSLRSPLLLSCEFSNLYSGALQYLTFTRPDISYAVQQVCLFMHDPREPHLSALKRILRYVRGTLSYGLQLYSSTTSSLVAYSDADWAGCPTTRRSTSGYCVFLGNNLLSWSSKRQFTLSRSSAEAEYRGVANAVAETCWLRNLLRELHTPLATATLVYCDNVSAVYLSSNPVQHQRTKHIEIDIHFVRDLVATGAIRVLHVPSRYQYADIFTKGLPTSLFDEFRTSLSVRSSPAPTAGGLTSVRCFTIAIWMCKFEYSLAMSKASKSKMSNPTVVPRDIGKVDVPFEPKLCSVHFYFTYRALAKFYYCSALACYKAFPTSRF